MNEDRRGLTAGIVAYTIWGLMPLYLKQLTHVPPADVLVCRVLLTLLLGLGLILVSGRRSELVAVMRDWRRLMLLAASASAIAVNWLTYILAVNYNHVVQASLGHYINPLIIVLVGVVFFREKLRLSAKLAVLLASAGVGLLTWHTGSVPWIVLGLTVTFAAYSVIRRKVPVDAFTGLVVETIVLSPLALAWVLVMGIGTSHDLKTSLFLAGMAPFSAIPLVLFAFAARQLPFSVLGLVQFLAPTLMFLLGVFVYDEPMGVIQVAAFTLIWTGLAIYIGDSLRHARRRALAQVETLG